MRLTILAVGRLGRCPEAVLVADYLDRATAVGRSLGLGPAELVEVDGRKPGRQAESDALNAALDGALVGAGDARLVACDERGAVKTSRGFAADVGAWRDQGVRRLIFLIGGADGLAADVVERAALRVCFGAQTWPHALARVMLAEQVYRATTILAGGPYHRD